MSNPPAFQMYASDYYLDTNSWTVDEIGIYQRLLLTEWVNGGLPNDEVRLARIAGCSLKKFQKGWRIIKFKFTQNGDNLLVNKRLENVREQQAKYRELQSEKGKLSAEKRWKDHITVVKKRLQPKDNTSSSTSTSKDIKNKDIYGEFSNVKLTQEEYSKLITKFGEPATKEKIENLSIYLASKGKKYANHYATILTWDRKNPTPIPLRKIEPSNIPRTDPSVENMLKQAIKEGWR